MSQVARRLAPTLALALLAASAGCGDDHEHDHDHAAHVDPAHRPENFPDAVDRLIAGHEASRVALSAGRVDEAHDELLPIQRDLVKWLPEVAADSDMPEGAWNRVDALSARLLAAYEPVLADLDAGRPVAGDRLAPAEPALEDLRTLRDEADPSWFPEPRRNAEPSPMDAEAGVAGIAVEGDAPASEPAADQVRDTLGISEE
jgi:hypothetical protein